MPTSKRPQQGKEDKPESSSSVGGKKRKHKSKPTGKARAKKQRTKDRYAHAREDAQLEGLIPTRPEEALTNERVTPSLGPGLPEIVRTSLRQNWATPDAAKPAIIAALLEPFFQDEVVLDKDGNQVLVKPSRKMLMALANTLRMLDQTQYERDNPQAAGMAKGGNKQQITIAGSVEANMLAVTVLRRMFEDDIGRGSTALPPPIESLPPSHSRFDGEVEVGAASTED